eukprot:sb/3463359/
MVESSGFVYPQLGVSAEKLGKVAISDTQTLISIIIKLPDIKGDIDRIKYHALSHKPCYSTYISKFSKEISRLKTSENHWIQRADQYINTRLNILSPYIIKLEEKSGRDQRSIIKYLPSVLNLVFNGITEYQIIRLKQHLKSNKQIIAQLKQKINNQNMTIKIIQQNIVALIKSSYDNLIRYIDSSNCIIHTEVLIQEMENIFWRHTQIIDKIIGPALEGKSKISLNPSIISPEMLELIISNHTELSNSIFYANPHLLYSVAEISLINVAQNLSTVHFVLLIPVIYKSDELYDINKIHQIGSFIPNSQDQCLFYDLPKHIILKKSSSWDIDINSCKQHNSLFVCPTYSILNTTSCLQSEEIKCQSREQACPFLCTYNLLPQGILFRDNFGNQAYSISEKGIINPISTPPSKSSFVSWDTIKAAQVCRTHIESPYLEPEPIIINQFSFPYNHNITSSQLTAQLTSLCNELNKTAEELLLPLIDHQKSESNKTKNNHHTSLYIFLGVTAPAILLSLGVALFLTYKYNPHTVAVVTHAIRRRCTCCLPNHVYDEAIDLRVNSLYDQNKLYPNLSNESDTRSNIT